MNIEINRDDYPPIIGTIEIVTFGKGGEYVRADSLSKSAFDLFCEAKSYGLIGDLQVAQRLLEIGEKLIGRTFGTQEGWDAWMMEQEHDKEILS